VNPSRRQCLHAGGAALTAALLPEAVAAPRYPAVRPGVPLLFPRDHGAHEAFRSEWWYITGWLRERSEWIGFQLTFFRARTGHADANPSRFAPHQLLIAHAALAVPGHDRLHHAQRAARSGFGLAMASSADTDVHIGDWSLRRDADDRYRALIAAPEFTLALQLAPPGPPLAQGENGYSRKGPNPEQASYYYSRPQLAVTGSVRVAGQDKGATRSARRTLGPERAVSGAAWLDHEWSSELLAADATGWDWMGLNFDDGTALMAFRIRRADDSTVWSHARWISAAELHSGAEPSPSSSRPRFPPASGAEPLPSPAPAPVFEPLRRWRSPRSGATYPVAMRVRSAGRTFELLPLFDDQELDASASSGTIYWEGAVTVVENGRTVGRGYLELTGYAGRPPV